MAFYGKFLTFIGENKLGLWLIATVLCMLVELELAWAIWNLFQ